MHTPGRLFALYLCLVGICLVIPLPAAQGVEITSFAGYRFGGEFEEAE